MINVIFFFIEKTKIANYAENNTQFATGKTFDALLNLHETSIVLNWFRSNEMKANDDKCHLIVPNHKNVSVTVGNECIEAEESVTLLSVTIDKELNLSDHVVNLLKKGNQKLRGLARISKYVSKDKLQMIKSQFNYCLLLWMFHSRTLNNKNK